MAASLGWYAALAVLSFLFVTQPATFATTIYLHRGTAHRSLTFHPSVRFLFEAILWITTGLAGKSRRYWVAVHRKHHAYSDVEGDPHSPILEGLWPIQWGNFFYYLKAGRRDPKLLMLARDVEFSWAERRLFRYTWLGPVLGTALLVTIFGILPGLFMAAVHAFLYVVVLNGSVNGLCHVWGYKRFPKAVAFNVRTVAMLSAGEGLHNNHHEEPGRAFLSPRGDERRPLEVDPAEWVIRFLLRFELARLARAEHRTP